jgi:prepilin-type processing-associated H-X9-DG protein
LVVVAIIALLLGILLPSVNRAREVANTTVCLTNTRSIASAVAQYANSHNDVIVPSWKDNTVFGVEYEHHRYMPGILVANDYMSADMPLRDDFRGGDPVPESGFTCPTANLELGRGVGGAGEGGWNSATRPPADRTNDEWDDGAVSAMRYDDDDGEERAVFSHYGVNGSNSNENLPFVWLDSTFQGEVGDRWKGLWRINDLQFPVDQVLITDGRGITQGGPNRILSRHGGDATRINISFFDGHAETIQKYDSQGNVLLWQLAGSPEGAPAEPGIHQMAYFAEMRGAAVSPAPPYFFVYERGKPRYPD